MPDAILFDLDGTLIDSARDVATAANRALVDLGRPERDQGEVRAFIGDGVGLLMARCLGDGAGGRAVEAAVARFRVHYDACVLETTALFPGIAELLAAIDSPMAVVSNKPEAFCRRILAGLDAVRWFDVVAGGDTFDEGKPSPVPVTETCALLGVPARRAVVVGDGRQDMLAGRAAGCRTVGVLWGQASEEELRAAGAGVTVATMDALLGSLVGP
jgi:phosphoglycolate phosphatase